MLLKGNLIKWILLNCDYIFYFKIGLGTHGGFKSIYCLNLSNPVNNII